MELALLYADLVVLKIFKRHVVAFFEESVLQEVRTLYVISTITV